MFKSDVATNFILQSASISPRSKRTTNAKGESVEVVTQVCNCRLAKVGAGGAGEDREADNIQLTYELAKGEYGPAAGAVYAISLKAV